MVDIEADGPIPGDYSMVCFGAIIVEPQLNRTFYGQLRTDIRTLDSEALSSAALVARRQCLSKNRRSNAAIC